MRPRVVYRDASINLHDISIDPREMTDGIAPVAPRRVARLDTLEYICIYIYMALCISDYQIFLEDIRRRIFDYL